MNTQKAWFVVEFKVADFYYANVVPFTSSDNLARKFRDPSVISASVFTTKKEAQSVATAMNNRYSEDGTYLFDGRY